MVNGAEEGSKGAGQRRAAREGKGGQGGKRRRKEEEKKKKIEKAFYQINVTGFISFCKLFIVSLKFFLVTLHKYSNSTFISQVPVNSSKTIRKISTLLVPSFCYFRTVIEAHLPSCHARDYAFDSSFKFVFCSERRGGERKLKRALKIIPIFIF